MLSIPFWRIHHLFYCLWLPVSVRILLHVLNSCWVWFVGYEQALRVIQSQLAAEKRSIDDAVCELQQNAAEEEEEEEEEVVCVLQDDNV